MGLADGSIDILVGTHAIFQQAVSYKRLGLAVIDEQITAARHATRLRDPQDAAAAADRLAELQQIRDAYEAGEQP